MSRDTVHALITTLGGDVLTPTQKDSYLNVAYPGVLSVFATWGEHHLGSLISFQYIDTVAAQEEYDFPATSGIPTVIDVKEVAVSSDGTTFVNCKRVVPFALPKETTGSIIPTVYFVQRGKITFYPAPSSAVTNGIRLLTVQRPDVLSDSSTDTGMSNEAEMIWALKALAIHHGVHSDGDQLSRVEGTAAQIVNSLKAYTPVAGD